MGATNSTRNTKIVGAGIMDFFIEELFGSSEEIERGVVMTYVL
jgi:hypothetical protein